MLQLKIEEFFENTFAVYILEYNKENSPGVLLNKISKNKMKMLLCILEYFEKMMRIEVIFVHYVHCAVSLQNYLVRHDHSELDRG